MENLKMETLKRIAKTLPIGYYLGRKVNVDFDETSFESYYSPLEDKIKISLPMIYTIIERDKIEDIEEFEKDIRCLLYHEISHIILTPKNLYSYCESWFKRHMNTFEDTRIETILKNYYMLVDFKGFVKKVNNFKGQAPKSVDELFYQVVRFNVGKQELIDFKNQIIEKYKTLSKANENDLYGYTMLVKQLYAMCSEEFEKQQEEQQNQNQNQKQNGKGKKSNQKQSGNDNQEDQEEDFEDDEDQDQEDNESQDENENQNQGQEDSQDQDENGNDGCGLEEQNENQNQDVQQDQEDNEEDLINIEQLQDMVKEIFKKLTDIYATDNQFYNKLKEMIIKRRGKGNQVGGVLNYSGKRFNVKSYIKPNTDYRWFERKNGNGNIQNQDKLKINLYIDNSGSFSDHELKVNKMLTTLKKIERELSDLEITLTTINSSVVERKLEKDFVFVCGGGTYFTDNIVSIVRKNNATKNNRVNIVLFDGDVTNGHHFSNFNDNKSIIIYESENKNKVERYAPKAIKMFIENNEYEEKLTQAITDALYRVLG